MDYLLGPLLLFLSAPGVYNAPLDISLDDIQNNTTIFGHSRHQRKVPETSYALPEDITVTLDAPKPESIYNSTDQSSFDGNFSYSFAAENGINVEVKGSQKQIGTSMGQVMEGRYSYTAPDGTPIAVKWYADETGFHPTILRP